LSVEERSLPMGFAARLPVRSNDFLQRTVPTVYSATVRTNADLFPEVLCLHVPRGVTGADVTWGKGVFLASRNTRFWRPTWRATGLTAESCPRTLSRVEIVEAGPR